MSDDLKKTGAIKQDNGKLSAAEKQARLAEALRANLRRRKDQARERKPAPEAKGGNTDA